MALNDVFCPLAFGHPKVKNIPSTGDNLFDLTGPDSNGEMLVPCQEIIIAPRTQNIKLAEAAGDIPAGRYFTVIGNMTLRHVRNGKLYMQGIGGATDVEVYVR